MTKRKFSIVNVGTVPHTKKDFNRLLKEDKPNLIINVTGVKCDVSVDTEVYSEDDLAKIVNIVNSMSGNIWIDRTYVCYQGNRFKNAFIKEDGWYKLNRELIKDCLGKTSKRRSQYTMEAILMLVSYYLYDIVSKYGYDIDSVGIDFKEDMKFDTSYYVDDRTSWNF